MPTIEHFDEDAHAARNGYGDNEDGLDLFGMPPSYTDAELLAMAAEYEPSPVAAILQERLRDFELDQMGAKRNSPQWLEINGYIGFVQAIQRQVMNV